MLPPSVMWVMHMTYAPPQVRVGRLFRLFDNGLRSILVLVDWPPAAPPHSAPIELATVRTPTAPTSPTFPEAPFAIRTAPRHSAAAASSRPGPARPGPTRTRPARPDSDEGGVAGVSLVTVRSGAAMRAERVAAARAAAAAAAQQVPAESGEGGGD